MSLAMKVKQARPSRARGERLLKRRNRRFRLRFNLGKAMFVLPNLFTVSSIFCGFYAIILVSGDPGPTQMYQATLAVFFGMFFDGADGRVARMTRTQSEFGVQIDSLADVITFGVAPAVILHKWGLSQLGIAGTAVAFAYVACGAIRLARFNVLAARTGDGASQFFVGLPIPLAAGMVMSMVMFHQRTFARPPTHAVHVLLLVIIVSYLMVSNVRYRTFKSVKPNRRSLSVFAALLVGFALMASQVRPTFALLVFVSGYIALGLLEEVVFFRRRRRENKPATKSP